MKTYLSPIDLEVIAYCDRLQAARKASMNEEEKQDLEKQFAKRFYKNPKGNYVSSLDRTTIYFRGGSWMYSQDYAGRTKFGRNQFDSPLECFEWLKQNKKI